MECEFEDKMAGVMGTGCVETQKENGFAYLGSGNVVEVSHLIEKVLGLTRQGNGLVELEHGWVELCLRQAELGLVQVELGLGEVELDLV